MHTKLLLESAVLCLSLLTVLLSESQQGQVADWNVRVWASIDDFRAHLGAIRPFKLVLEESPRSTALGTALCFVVGLFNLLLFGAVATFFLAALTGGAIANAHVETLQPRIALLFWNYGAIILVALWGVIASAWMVILSIWAAIAACIIVTLWIIELTVRRLAEYRKGPLFAAIILLAAALSFLKMFG